MPIHEQGPSMTPEQEARIDHLVDTGVANYSEAVAQIVGSPMLGAVAARSAISAGPSRGLPGKPSSYPKSGHVRDFADGGREDRYRGGMTPPSTPEARAAYDAVKPDLDKLQESHLRDKIQTEYLADKLTYREAKAQIRKHFGDRTDEIVREDLGEENRKYTVTPRK